MDKTDVRYRSRRRRASFALFGRSRQRTALTGIMHAQAHEPGARLGHEERTIETVLTDEPQEPRVADRVADAQQDAELQALITRLQAEARADRYLAGRLTALELDLLIDETVRSLWAESRVTAFVPLLAMRRIHDQLGLTAKADDAGAARLDA